MGHLSSCLQKIEDIQFKTFNNKGDPVPNAVKITKVDYAYYVLGKNGVVYTDGCVGRDVCLNDYTNKAAKGLYQLGLITRQELRLHIKSMNLRKESSRSYEENESFKKRAANLGIELDGAQLAILDKRRQAIKEKYGEQVTPLAVKLNEAYKAQRCQNG
jgi:hypothetical protein